MKRPLAWPSVLFIAGIILAEVSGLSFTLFVAVALLFALAALAWSSQCQPLVACSIIAAGAAALALQTKVVGPQDLRNVIGIEPRIVTIKGTLVETPYQRFYEDRIRFLTKLRCEQLQLAGGACRSVSGTIGVVTSGMPVEHLWHGQAVEVTGLIKQPDRALAPELFDYRAYLRRLGIHYVLRVSSPGEWKVPGATNPPIPVRFNDWAKETLAHGLPCEDEPLRLLWAMTLGWKTALNGEVAEPFMRSGTLHVFAISGLHIMMIAAIIAGVLRGVRIPRRICALIVISVVWFYTCATGWQASAVRSAVMATVFFGSWVLIRPPNLFNSLAAAALIILLYDPQQLFQAGFQLSFAVVFCLALFGNYFRAFKDPIASGDPLIPWDVRPWWERQCLRGARYVVAMAITAVAAWLGSIPLTAHYFHLFTPVSVISNLVVVPMSAAALASNLASLFFGAWFPVASDILNNSAWFWMKAMLWVSEWTARWPGAALHVSAPGPFLIAFYYVTLIAIAARWFSNTQVRPWICSAILVLAVSAGVEVSRQYARSSLTVLPLSGGHAVFMDAPGADRDVLIDCGDDGSARIIVKAFLQAEGTRRLPNIVLTHGDVDHVGGLTTLMDVFAPERIVVPAVSFPSSVYRKQIQMARDRSANVIQLAPGKTVGDWTIVYPDSQDKLPHADDKALVLHGNVRGTRVLLLPDLSVVGQNALIARGVDVRSDIVIASVPAGSEPVCDPLLDRIQPRLIIIADAMSPPDARAREPLRQRLARRGIPVLYTTDGGAITINFTTKNAIVRSAWKKTGPISVNARSVNESAAISPPHISFAE